MAPKETIEDLKYLLGNMGVEILLSIDKGAKNFETIQLFSGIPMACIKGRIPVLLDLELILLDSENGYKLTDKGFQFRSSILKAKKE